MKATLGSQSHHLDAVENESQNFACSTRRNRIALAWRKDSEKTRSHSTLNNQSLAEVVRRLGIRQTLPTCPTPKTRL